MRKQNLSRYLILIFYALAMVTLVCYAWYKQNIINHRGSSPLYINLRECPSYARKGFEPADLRKIPDEASGVWRRFEGSTRRIVNSSLELPKRRYLSPRGKDAQEFTVITLLETDNAAMAFLAENNTPGIFFAGIGENWEVYFNGKLIVSEMHLDETGRITERRTWRDVFFPVDSSLVLPGTNILALRIVGDPTYRGTGLFYTAAPIYMEDYKVIDGRRFNFVHIALCGIFIYTGIYYLMVFFSVKKKSELFNLYFGVFSILLCIYSVSVDSMFKLLVPNSDISIRLETGSNILSIAALGIFIEALIRGKITKISRAYLAACLFMCLTQIFFCVEYGEEILIIWDAITMFYITYLLVYDVIYFYFRDRQKGEKADLPIGSILVGMVLGYVCGLIDILDNILFLNISIELFPYSIFAVHTGMAFTLSQRFSGMYKRLEKSNIMLELAVQERTVELERQTEIAVQASRAKSQFLATMSHEIRTPLNAVIGLSEIELQGSDARCEAGSQANRLPDSSRENIMQIHQSGASLLGIINEILDISKIEAGSFELVPAEYDTASFINDTVNLNMVRIGSRPINFVLEINGDFPAKLTGDELRVKQVLNNLLSNAIKYTGKGTVTLNIAWSVHGPGTVRLIFTVRDTGIGIRAEDMGKLFTSYTQLDTGANRKIEGTGLGLAITKNLVEMMGGAISAKSEYGKGSVFTAEIIQGLVDGDQSLGEETAEALRNFRYAAEKKDKNIIPSLLPQVRVLVVDDLPANLLVARGLLAPYGLRADTAASGREAIEMVKNHNYDLIFMDHMMPEMDGIETAEAIRQLTINNEQLTKSVKRTPIIALTANALRGMKEFYLEKGFDDYLSKPITPEALDEIINKWLNKQLTINNEQLAINNEQASSGGGSSSSLLISNSSLLIEIEAQRLDILNHYLVSFTCVPETDWQAKFDAAYFERFTALIKSLNTAGTPAELREQQELLAGAGQKEDVYAIREALPAFCDALRKWREQEQNTADNEYNKLPDEILSRLKKALLAGETETAEAAIGELGEKALTPAGRELYFRLYALMLEGNTEKIMEAIKEAAPLKELAPPKEAMHD
jgi:signal transduction histidine kinase/CheY-like chemotaxis protein